MLRSNPVRELRISQACQLDVSSCVDIVAHVPINQYRTNRGILIDKRFTSVKTMATQYTLSMILLVLAIKITILGQSQETMHGTFKRRR